MTQEINLGGAIYISSKRAAEITGYTQDYIGQLARAGAILAQRVSGLWYVNEESLKSHKDSADEYVPVPPQRTEHIDLEAAVSFDGKNYISAQRAAKITGYHQDYVGQLARSGKILSRQIGSRWYVDREGLIEHKKYNDSLLAAVQAESVGLAPAEAEITEPEMHFNYISEATPTIPGISEKREELDRLIDAQDDQIAEAELETHEIPIRVIRPAAEISQSRHTAGTRYPNSRPRRYIFVIIFIVALILGFATTLVMFNKQILSGVHLRRGAEGDALGALNTASRRISTIRELPFIGLISSFVSQDIDYHRQSNF